MKRDFSDRFKSVSTGSHLAKRIALLIAVCGLVYIARPLVHGVVYPLIYEPTWLLVGGSTLIAAVGLWLAPPLTTEGRQVDGGSLSLFLSDSAVTKLGLLGTLFAVLFVIGRHRTNARGSDDGREPADRRAPIDQP